MTNPLEIFGVVCDAGARTDTDIKELERRLTQLCEAIQQALDASKVTATALSRVADILRWTRFYVNVSLAFQRQVRPLRDEAWSTARYTTEARARELLAAFREMSKGLSASRFNLVELRNLSARVDGLTTIVDGWRRAVG
jgi:hypothetical protein